MLAEFGKPEEVPKRKYKETQQSTPERLGMQLEFNFTPHPSNVNFILLEVTGR